MITKSNHCIQQRQKLSFFDVLTAWRKRSGPRNLLRYNVMQCKNSLFIVPWMTKSHFKGAVHWRVAIINDVYTASTKNDSTIVNNLLIVQERHFIVDSVVQ